MAQNCRAKINTIGISTVHAIANISAEPVTRVEVSFDQVRRVVEAWGPFMWPDIFPEYGS